MPNTSLTRQLSIVIYKHPKLGKILAPMHKSLWITLPTAYRRLMNGTSVDAVSAPQLKQGHPPRKDL